MNNNIRRKNDNMSNDNNKTAHNPLSDWLDDKLIIVGLDKSNELSLRKKLEEDLTKSFIKDETKRMAQNKKHAKKEGETA